MLNVICYLLYEVLYLLSVNFTISDPAVRESSRATPLSGGVEGSQWDSGQARMTFK